MNVRSGSLNINNRSLKVVVQGPDFMAHPLHMMMEMKFKFQKYFKDLNRVQQIIEHWES
jgi:hypothetical protein